MPEFTETIDVALPVEACYALVRDFTSYVNFIPALKSVKVTSDHDVHPEVTFRLEAPLGEIVYTLRYTVDGPENTSWEMLKSNVLKDTRGFWKIVPGPDGGSKVTYNMSTRLPAWMAWAITDAAYAREIGKTVQRFKAYAEAQKE